MIAVMSSLLFLRAESPNLIYDCGQQSLARQFPMLPQRFNQAPFAKFFSVLVTGFGDAIRIKRKHVARTEFLLPHGAIPLSEQTQAACWSNQAAHVTVGSQQKARQMSAIGVSQSPRRVVVLGKKKRCVGISPVLS